MAKFTVNVPESSSRRKFTIQQFLVEFAEQPEGDRRRLFRFREPVCVIIADRDNKLSGHCYQLAPDLFRAFQEYVRDEATIVELGAQHWHLGYRHLYELNRALNTPFRRKGGLNIVRNFLENQKGSYLPQRGTFDALMAYLEIRPIFTVSDKFSTLPMAPAPAAVSSQPTPSATP